MLRRLLAPLRTTVAATAAPFRAISHVSELMPPSAALMDPKNAFSFASPSLPHTRCPIQLDSRFPILSLADLDTNGILINDVNPHVDGVWPPAVCIVAARGRCLRRRSDFMLPPCALAATARCAACAVASLR